MEDHLSLQKMVVSPQLGYLLLQDIDIFVLLGQLNLEVIHQFPQLVLLAGHGLYFDVVLLCLLMENVCQIFHRLLHH